MNWSEVAPEVEAAATGLEVYRVRDCWKLRRGLPKRVAKHWWQRTWQAEWEGVQHCPRAWTRHGVIVKAVRQRMREWLT